MDHGSTVVAAITAALTFVLILVTGFYAWANYRVMRIMQADIRARTEPIPRIGIHFNDLNVYPRQLTVNVRVEHAPMRLALLNIALHGPNQTGRWVWVECEIGDPRTIAPGTPVEFSATYRARKNPEAWTAVAHYTDLGGALEYHMKLNSQGFHLVQAYTPPGPIIGFFKRVAEKISDTVNDMDRSEG